MLLDLGRIRTPHEHYEKVYKPEAFTGEADYQIVEPVSLEFDLHKDKDVFRLVGRVRSRLELPCGRCLEPFRWPVDEPFELTYVPQARNTGETEREIHDEDFSTAFYVNEQIDLEQLMRERFEMSMPMKPLCAPDCQGLCPSCGINLNRSRCDCKAGWEDPRFAVLRSLRTKGDS